MGSSSMNVELIQNLKVMSVDSTENAITSVGGASGDCLSKLPSDILINILSLLPLKEAARTTVLSSLCKNLWKHVSCLHFHAIHDEWNLAYCQTKRERERLEQEKALQRIELEKDLNWDEENWELEWDDKELKVSRMIEASAEKRVKLHRHKFLKWAHSVVRSHKALTLKEFKIDFDLDKANSKAITRLIRFALSRKVQRLELNLHGRKRWEEYYCFSQVLVSGLTPLDFKCLKALHFKYVNMSDVSIDFFLQNCPLLEELFLSQVRISNLQVCSSSHMLKYLKFSGMDVTTVNVSMPSLKSLKADFSRKIETVLVENVPMLVNLSITCIQSRNPTLENLLRALSCTARGLETLRVNLVRFEGSTIEISDCCPELPKLKNLVIKHWELCDESLISLMPLLRASPYLEEFHFKFTACRNPMEDREIEDAINFPHHHLKVFKITGYYGGINDLELLSYIIKNCINLEKIIIEKIVTDPREEIRCIGFVEGTQTQRNNAKRQLESLVGPRHIQIVVL